MTYGPPEYPRATSSPPIVVLIAGLAAVLGFLIGYFTGVGTSASAVPTLRPTRPETTVTIEEPTESPGTAGPETTASGVQPTDQPTAPAGQPTVGQPTAGQPTAGQPTAGQPTQQAGQSQAKVPGNGTLVVGRDIQPGTYKTAGPLAGQTMCYWARLKDTSLDLANVLDSGMPKGPATVTIVPTDKAFQTGGCADWIKQ
ncbi:hypothetical protein ACIBG8_15840 [Nonomuraea sp. NPDC050556]|uniref:hypothetical protein n=1 Tax=Nonomuraea sp. NPDC050556 TaxID=3364369 RepID=UPI00379F107E